MLSLLLVHSCSLELSASMDHLPAMELSRAVVHFGLLELYLGSGSILDRETLWSHASLICNGALSLAGSLSRRVTLI